MKCAEGSCLEERIGAVFVVQVLPSLKSDGWMGMQSRSDVQMRV